MKEYTIKDLESLTSADIINKTILYPTETIYGLGCSLFDPKSTYGISIAKKRPGQKQYIKLIDSIGRIINFVEPLSKEEIALLESNLSVTVLLKPLEICPREYLHPVDGLFSVRKTTHPICLRLIELLNAPLLSTSANISGEEPTTDFANLPDELIQSVDIVIDAGKIPDAIPSTIVQFKEGTFEIVRQGQVTLEDINTVLK